MRKIHWSTALMLTWFCVWGSAAEGEDLYYLNRGDNGFNLPGVTLPQGQDEVHASDGTTCRSAVSGSGTYLDVGAINGSMNNNGNIATYARVVIPLGKQSTRLDCAKLYALEVERLELELKLLKMGLASNGGGASPGEPAPPASFSGKGWSDAGLHSAKR